MYHRSWAVMTLLCLCLSPTTRAEGMWDVGTRRLLFLRPLCEDLWCIHTAFTFAPSEPETYISIFLSAQMRGGVSSPPRPI
jgi:hypothetical protein